MDVFDPFRIVQELPVVGDLIGPSRGSRGLPVVGGVTLKGLNPASPALEMGEGFVEGIVNDVRGLVKTFGIGVLKMIPFVWDNRLLRKRLVDIFSQAHSAEDTVTHTVGHPMRAPGNVEKHVGDTEKNVLRIARLQASASRQLRQMGPEKLGQLSQQIKQAAAQAALLDKVAKVASRVDSLEKKARSQETAHKKLASSVDVHMDKVKTAFKKVRETSSSLGNAQRQVASEVGALSSETKSIKSASADVSALEDHMSKLDTLEKKVQKMEPVVSKLHAESNRKELASTVSLWKILSSNTKAQPVETSRTAESAAPECGKNDAPSAESSDADAALQRMYKATRSSAVAFLKSVEEPSDAKLKKSFARVQKACAKYKPKKLCDCEEQISQKTMISDSELIARHLDAEISRGAQ